MNGVATTGSQGTDGKEVSTDGVSDGSESRAIPESPPMSCAQPADTTEAVSDEVPRRRRGILLGTRREGEAPAAADDEKSLAWMADQAVKALNAVKASQMEQAQALKAKGEIGQEESGSDREDDDIHHVASDTPTPEQQLAAMRMLNAEEISADAASLAVQSGMAAAAPLPASTPPVQTATVGEPGTVPPGETSMHAPPPPAAVGAAATSRLPVRAILLVGFLLMFGYAGYHYWFSGAREAGRIPSPPSATGEPSGPELGKEMAAPAISVVPAPEPVNRSAGPVPAQVPSVVTPPAGEPESGEPAATRAPPPPLVEPTRPTVAAPQPVTAPGTWQPAAAPFPGSAGTAGEAPERTEPAVAVEPSTPAAANPEPAPVPQTWAPAGSPAAEPDREPIPSAPTPAPSVRAEPSARPPAPPAPATRPAYPAGGYGYYPPPASWQPYYRQVYPQAPARQ